MMVEFGMSVSKYSKEALDTSTGKSAASIKNQLAFSQHNLCHTMYNDLYRPEKSNFNVLYNARW